MTTHREQALRPLDDEARQLARALVQEATHAVLAVLEPSTGFPLASRVAVAAESTGDIILLVSILSMHTAGLEADGRCSLLIGEPGAGNPLTQPRLTAIGRATLMDSLDPNRPALLRCFLAKHPNAAVYADFADFVLVRVAIERGNLNAGFARAFVLGREDLVGPTGSEQAGVAETATETARKIQTVIG